MRPQLAAALRKFPEARHIWVEDGKGKPLGRSFRVKLWPTLVFLKDGQVVRQAVRPEMGEVEQGLREITEERSEAKGQSSEDPERGASAP